MAAMKDLYIDMMDRVYNTIRDLGVSQEIIFKFERLFTDDRKLGMKFEDFAEKMAGYAAAIYFLSPMYKYEPERLWDIWYEMAEDAIGDGVAELDKEWESFKTTTRERDW